jgi:four helix bundle protein
LISINNNIDDGFELSGIKEFLQYLWISKASAGECRSQLYRAFDTEIIDEKQFNDLK